MLCRQAGQVGYMHAGIRQPDDARVGDTVCNAGGGGKLITPLEGFKPAKPMVISKLNRKSAVYKQLISNYPP